MYLNALRTGVQAITDCAVYGIRSCWRARMNFMVFEMRVALYRCHDICPWTAILKVALRFYFLRLCIFKCKKTGNSFPFTILLLPYLAGKITGKFIKMDLVLFEAIINANKHKQIIYYSLQWCEWFGNEREKSDKNLLRLPSCVIVM